MLEAKAGDDTEITTVNITVTDPVGGASLNHSCNTTTEGVIVSVDLTSEYKQGWKHVDANGNDPKPLTFTAGEEYEFTFVIKTDEGFTFGSSKPTVNVNGTVLSSNDVSDWNSGEFLCTYFATASSGSAGSSSSSSSTPSAPATPPHVHSCTWQVLQAATPKYAGVEGYVCSDCGAIVAKREIKPDAAIMNTMTTAFAAPAAGKGIEIDTLWWHTMTDGLIQELAKNSTSEIKITFDYQGKRYLMTIPAGTDYTALLEDKVFFYGYFYFASLIKASVEPIS